ncbi:hypothetical protein J0H58_29550 [bacterium]|nr:hypothetical protein [bacterium]
MLRRLLSALWPFRRRPRHDPRATFEFWDGDRWRAADPIAVWGRLNAGRDVEDDLRVVLTPGPDGMDEATAARFAAARHKAAEALADRVCAAFGVEAFADGRGLTVPERVSLAAEFVGHMARLGAVAVPTSASSFSA